MSPKARARLAGVFQALEGFPAVFGQVAVLAMLVDHKDAVVTANNILAHQDLYRAGFAIPVAAVGFHIVWALLLYQLLRPVNQTVSMLGFVVILVGCAIQAVAALLYLAPLVILGDTADVAARAQLAMSFIGLSSQAFNLYLVFFGLWCVLTGYLIFRSTFLPRLLGVLLIADGIGWMLFLWQPLATAVYPAIAVVAGLAEIPLLLWFLVFGVNEERWLAVASRTAARSEVGA
jgi:hypothetical protein